MLRGFHVAHLPCVFELRACRFRAYRRGVVLVGVEGRIEIDEVDYLVVESSEDIEIVAGEDGRRLDVRATPPLLRRCSAAIVPSLLPPVKWLEVDFRHVRALDAASRDARNVRGCRSQHRPWC